MIVHYFGNQTRTIHKRWLWSGKRLQNGAFLLYVVAIYMAAVGASCQETGLQKLIYVVETTLRFCYSAMVMETLEIGRVVVDEDTSGRIILRSF